MKSQIEKFVHNKKGQGMSEYLIILALVAVAGLVAVGGFGNKIKTKFTDAKGSVDNLDTNEKYQ